MTGWRDRPLVPSLPRQKRATPSPRAWKTSVPASPHSMGAVTAAGAARELGLPMTNNPMLVIAPPTDKRWEHFGEQLAAIFHSALPGRSKEAAYRFIKAVVPDITGEQPSFEAIKTAFKKKALSIRHFCGSSLEIIFKSKRL